MNRTHWNQLAGRFDTAVCDIVLVDRNGILDELVKRAVRRRPNPIVVDLGCGSGTFLRKFGSLFREATGVDYASQMIAVARRRCASLPHVRWLCASVEQAPMLLGPVADFAVCLNVLTATARRRRDAQWASVAAVNKPGGIALFVLPSVESARFVVRAAGAPPRRPERARRDHHVRRGRYLQKLYTREEILDCFTRYGYRGICIRRVPYPWRVEGTTRPAATDPGQPWHWACLAVRSVRRGTD